MEQSTIEQKVIELCNDEAFREKLALCGTVEEIAQAFTDEGVELTGEDLEAALAKATADLKSGELGEDELDNVAGGCIVSGTAFLIGCALVSLGTVAMSVIYASHQISKSKNSKKKKSSRR